MHKGSIEILIEKCINIPIIQVSFTNILKSSAVKPSAIIIVKTTVKNTGMQHILNCKIKNAKEMSENMQNLFIFLKNM